MTCTTTGLSCGDELGRGAVGLLGLVDHRGSSDLDQAQGPTGGIPSESESKAAAAGFKQAAKQLVAPPSSACASHTADFGATASLPGLSVVGAPPGGGGAPVVAGLVAAARALHHRNQGLLCGEALNAGPDHISIDNRRD